jgi:hypothetical protein
LFFLVPALAPQLTWRYQGSVRRNHQQVSINFEVRQSYEDL